MKPSIPKGTRDFSPEETAKRNYIFKTLANVFQLFGYQPIETPAMEKLSTLTGKYGEEGDRLIYKILNSGDFLKEVNPSNLDPAKHRELIPEISSKALRYDLTVPFARYIVQHRNELTFPFKRYQIQPVWRADRPQKGRYREFFQCDVDVIGNDSLLNELELVQIIDMGFSQLKFPVLIKVNNRKVLYGISEAVGANDKFMDFTIALDKLEKIGPEKVMEEMSTKGIGDESIQKLKPVLSLHGNTSEKLEFLKDFISNSETGMKGFEEMSQLFGLLDEIRLAGSIIEFDLTLARGLNYYTGAIIEVKAGQGSLKSTICAGGRYDDLTGIFGLPDVSGVGVSFGADRIYDVMSELKLFPNDLQTESKALLVNFGNNEEKYALKVAQELRTAGVSCELYPSPVKMRKQFEYADKKNIPFVIVAGSEEMKKGQLTLKEMRTGKQSSQTIANIIDKLLE